MTQDECSQSKEIAEVEARLRQQHEKNIIAASQMTPEYARDLEARLHAYHAHMQQHKQALNLAVEALADSTYGHRQERHVYPQPEVVTEDGGCMDFNPVRPEIVTAHPSREALVAYVNKDTEKVVKRFVGKPVRAVQMKGEHQVAGNGGFTLHDGDYLMEMVNSADGSRIWLPVSKDFVETNYRDWDAAEAQGAPPRTDDVVRLKGLLRQMFPQLFSAHSSNYAIAALERMVQDEGKTALLYNAETDDYFVAEAGTHRLVHNKVLEALEKSREMLAKEAEWTRPLAKLVQKFAGEVVEALK